MALTSHERIHKVTINFDEATGLFKSAQIEVARFWSSDTDGETVPRPDVLDPTSLSKEQVADALGQALADAIEERDAAIADANDARSAANAITASARTAYSALGVLLAN